MRLLDLYCGAGGAAMGYARAGFDVVGVDIKAQPRYPFPFVQGDALTYLDEHGTDFDVIHASPPCQRYSKNTKQHGTMDRHPDAIPWVRHRLRANGKPYVIENVDGSSLVPPAVILCGSMFGSVQLRRHRVFESSLLLLQPQCRHELQRDCISVAGHAGGVSRRDGSKRFGSTDVWRAVMGIDWMTGDELAEAIPPMFTEYLARQIVRALEAVA